MGNKQAGMCFLVWGLVVLTGSAVQAQDLFSGEAGGSAEAEAEAEAEGSPLDTMDSQPSNDEGEEGDGDGGGGLGGPLLLTKHTMQLGGEIAITPSVIASNGFHDGGGTFTFSPTAGYFVIDHLEILFAMNLYIPFGYLGTEPVGFGLAAGARYIFDFSVVCLYVGGMIGTSIEVPDNPRAAIENYFNISLPVGVLIPFNRHVALNAGAKFNFDIHVGDGTDPSVFSFPIGYFGVEGFFNFFAD